MLRKWRDDFMYQAGKAGISEDTARRLLSLAATLQRLAEAQCNGDWPADNGERQVIPCKECEGLWHPSAIKLGLCPECRTQDRVKRLLNGSGIIPRLPRRSPGLRPQVAAARWPRNWGASLAAG